MVSALGQSHPVDRFSLKKTTLTFLSSAIRDGSRYCTSIPFSVSVLVACVDNVREYFWTPGAIGFVFCVCRDCYDYPNNMSQFERDFGCPEGSLSNTFRNNTYMHLHIDKWAQNGAKDRVLRLVEAYKKAVAERQKGKE